MSEKKLLLVDTNIISHALTPNQTQAYASLFKDLEKEYSFVITGYTKYELMRSSDKGHREKIMTYLENDMTTVTLSDALMIFTSKIFYLYSQHVSTKGKKIGDGDIINAAFSIAKDCALITIDNNDHPTPFFKEIERKRVTYESKSKREAMDVVYILQPDIEHIKECFDKHAV